MESPSAKRRDLTGSRSRWVRFIWNGVSYTSLMPFDSLDWLGGWDLELESSESEREEPGQGEGEKK